MKITDFRNKTAILYARCSAENEKQQSTKIQIEQLKKCCTENGIYVVKEPFEENISGAVLEREQLDIILKSEPMADLLCIREVSRLSRSEDYNDAYSKLQELIKKYNIYILLDDTLIEKGKNELATDIMLMIKLFGAADERKKIRDRTSAALKKYKEESVFNVVSGKVSYGLMKVPNPNFVKGVNTKSVWVKNPDTWNNVVNVFELRSKGYSILKITQITGFSDATIRQIFNSKKVNHIMETEHPELLKKSIEKREQMKTVKIPHKHPNKYKGIIFYQDTKRVMTHQTTSRYVKYKLRDGSCAIQEKYIDDCVERTIRCMLNFFGLKVAELSKENNERLGELKSMKEGYISTNANIKEQIAKLNKNIMKFIKSNDEELENLAIDERNRLRVQMENNTIQIRNIEEEEKRISSIDYTNIHLNINQTNLPEFIKKYIEKVEVWRKDKYHLIVKVFVKREYISSNWYNYKQYEVLNHRGNSCKIHPLHIEGSGGYVFDTDAKGEALVEELMAGGYWDLQVPQLPYYTPEEIEEKFGNKK